MTESNENNSNDNGLTTSRDLARGIAEKTGMSVYAVEKVITALGDEVLESLRQGKTVRIRGIGTIEIEERAPRKVWVPRAGKTIEIGSRLYPRMKPCSAIRKEFK